MGDEDANDVAHAVEKNRVAQLGSVTVAGQEVVPVLDLAAQGIATDRTAMIQKTIKR